MQVFFLDTYLGKGKLYVMQYVFQNVWSFRGKSLSVILQPEGMRLIHIWIIKYPTIEQEKKVVIKVCVIVVICSLIKSNMD